MIRVVEKGFRGFDDEKGGFSGEDNGVDLSIK